MIHDGDLLVKMGLFCQQKLPLFLGLVFGPIFVSLSNVSAQVKLLPKVCPTCVADKGFDLDVVVHAVVSQNVFPIKHLIWANRTLKSFGARVSSLVVNF